MKRFLSSSILVSVLLLLSKILGFVRDLLLARFFGSADVLQAFLVAFRFPEFMRKLTSSGALTQIINPYIKGQISSRVKKFTVTILYFFTLILTIIILLAVFFSNSLVDIYAYGFADKPEILILTNKIFIIIIPYVFFNFLVGLILAILNSFSKYVISSFLPIILNFVMILMIILSPKFEIPIYAVAYSVLIAGVFQLVIAVIFLYKLIGRVSINKDVLLIRDLRVRDFLKKFPTSFFGVAILQINFLVETFFASFLISGSLAWLYYANRVNQFLDGIFGTAIATVMIPYLINCKNDNNEFYKNLAWIIRVVLLITLPAIIGLFVLAKPIVITLFYYGKFNLNDVNSTYLAILGYILSLFCTVLIRVIVSALYVKNRTKVVFVINLLCLILTIVLDSFIVHLYSQDKYAFVYMAIVSSIVALINLMIQILLLLEFNLKFFVRIYLPLEFLIKALIGCICMFVVLNLFDLSQNYWISLTIFGRLKSIFIIILTGVISYLIVLAFMRIRKSLKIKFM